jgi:UDP-N-acetylmuramoyl-tripeptide--D-alanyl-D-alanine ligase
MISLTAQQIADQTQGVVITGNAQARINRVCTDSRAVPRECLFIALKGDNFDGHTFVSQAGEQGARIAIVEDATVSAAPGMTLIRVADARRALGQLARSVRRSIGRTKVIAIAGSNGKTSTKNMLHAVLSRTLRGSASPKSFNNNIGVPATIFPVEESDDYVIVEIGTNHPGEVEQLSLIAEPDIAVITSIGEEHLEFFHDLDGVRKENARITAGLRINGQLFATGDDLPLHAHLSRPARTFGFNDNNELQARNVRVSLDGTSFYVNERSFFVPVPARHFAANALAVIAVARDMGLRDEDIRTGLALSQPSEMRMQKISAGSVTILNDAYNANPTSMHAALDTFAHIDWPGRKVVIAGEMRELGAHSSAAHERVVQHVLSATFDACIFVGDAYKSHLAGNQHWLNDTRDAAPIVEMLRDNDLVLLKGSRGVRLERIADAIVQRFTH